eukprot:1401142-Amphidinium_carterae.1
MVYVWVVVEDCSCYVAHFVCSSALASQGNVVHCCKLVDVSHNALCRTKGIPILFRNISLRGEVFRKHFHTMARKTQSPPVKTCIQLCLPPEPKDQGSLSYMTVSVRD